MKTAAALLLSFATLSAHAQTVYRCANSYSDSPCPQSRIVDAADPRSDAQRDDARRVAADEKRLGAEMQRDRLALLAAQKPAGASSLSGATPKPPEKARPKHAKRIKAKKVKPAAQA